MPRVSIVIPTLNRAHLLRASLRSAIEQSFADLEVLVFDDMSSDETPEIANSHTSASLRYVRSPVRLNMSESFEAALEHARGDYITFLTDDSYLLPDCVTRAFDAVMRHDVPLVVWRHAGYFDEHWVEPARRNTLWVPNVSHREIVFDSKLSLAQWFRTIQGRAQWMPRSINSMCHRSVIEAAKRSQGDFFLPPAPDHSSGVGMLMSTSTYVAIDDALVIDGVTRESVGPAQSFTRGKSAEDFYKSLGPSPQEATYLGIPTTSAIIAKSFERAAAAYTDAPRLDPRVVLAQINDDLAKLEAYGSDVSDSFALLDASAHELGTGFRLSLRAKRVRSRAKWSAIRLARSNSTLSAAAERARGLRPISGHNRRLGNIQEAADLLLEHSRSAARQA